MPLINGIYRPDFEANNQLPSWRQIGDPNDDPMQKAGQAGMSFVDMLKKRMGNANRPAGHDMMHPDAMPPMAPHVDTSLPAAAGEHGMPLAASKGIGGGGMKSL